MKILWVGNSGEEGGSHIIINVFIVWGTGCGIRSTCGERELLQRWRPSLYFNSVSNKMCVHCAVFSWYHQESSCRSKMPERGRRGIDINFGVWLSLVAVSSTGQWSYFLPDYNSRTCERPCFRAGGNGAELTCKFKYSLYEFQFSPPHLTRTTAPITTTIYRQFPIDSALDGFCSPYIFSCETPN